MRQSASVRILLILLGLALGFGGTLTSHAQATPLYFPASGHTLNDDAGFLSYWQSHNGERLLGLPITEAYSINELAVQYFENGRLEQWRDPASQSVFVRPGAVAREYSEALYRSFSAAQSRSSKVAVRHFAETDHSLGEPFLSFWTQANGMELFGAPISEAMWEMTDVGRRQVQYFSNVRLEYDASMAGTDSAMRVSNLGSALAALQAIDMTAIANPGYAEAGPQIPLQADRASIDTPKRSQPQPTAVPLPPASADTQATSPAPKAQKPQPAKPKQTNSRIGSGGAKLIVVDLSRQWLYAYEGDVIVFDAPVATGRDGMETPAGTFSIYSKLKVQTMDGVTDGEYWVVPNVPNVMYIHGGVALHGTYWHNLFGSGIRPSHGCINLPLKSTAWLYNWAPMGTTVQVQY